MAGAVARVSIRMLMLCHISRKVVSILEFGPHFSFVQRNFATAPIIQKFHFIHFCGISLSTAEYVSHSFTNAMPCNAMPYLLFYFDRHFKRLKKSCRLPVHVHSINSNSNSNSKSSYNTICVEQVNERTTARFV